MADRPITFKPPMVRALLEGRKTQTRRVLKPQPSDPPPAKCHPAHTARHLAPYLDAYCGEPKTTENPRGMSRIWHWWQVDDRCGPVAFKAPYAPGDRLWVRETWAPHYSGIGGFPPHYRADLSENRNEALSQNHAFGLIRWRSPVIMPRWASRLTLTVTDVRVQKLQEISEADAWAEGINQRVNATCRDDFRDLWNTIHGPDAWDRNHWVAAITFTVRQGNIDEGGGDG